MNIFYMIFVIAALGAVGGSINGLLSNEVRLPYLDKEARIWRPAWLGSIIVGAVAAVVVWGVYGPAASNYLLGSQVFQARVTVAEVLSSLLVGIGGAILLAVLREGS